MKPCKPGFFLVGRVFSTNSISLLLSYSDSFESYGLLVTFQKFVHLIKIVSYDGINLFIVFPHTLLSFCKVISDVPFSFDFGNLIYFFISLAKGLSIFLIFPKNQLLVALISSIVLIYISLISTLYYFLNPACFEFTLLFSFPCFLVQSLMLLIGTFLLSNTNV